MRRTRVVLTALVLAAAMFNSDTLAQTTPSESAAAPTADNAVMITVFLKHDQSQPLGELNAQLEKQGYYKAFPPPGVEVVSWYIIMGVGQVLGAKVGSHMVITRGTRFIRPIFISAVLALTLKLLYDTYAK